MKGFTILNIWIIALMALASCNESALDRESQPVSTESQSSDTDTTKISNSVITLLKTDTGVFRGVTFGMPAEKVKKLETPQQLDEETDAYLDYIIDYNFPESAEVIYHLDNKNQVSKIETVIYPADKESQKMVYNQLIQFYNNRYGQNPNIQGDTVRWNSGLDNLSLSMSKVDTHKVHDINLIFSPINSTTGSKVQ